MIPRMHGDLSSLPEGLYIGFFHGRNDPHEQLEDWGFDGPVVGPLQYWHTTYNCHLRGEFVAGSGYTYVEAGLAEDETYYTGSARIPVFAASFTLKLHDDMAMLTENGTTSYYGDWSVFYHKKEGME